MTSITIRNLDESVKRRLRVRAAEHGRSMEQEARDILGSALSEEQAVPTNLAAALQARALHQLRRSPGGWEHSHQQASSSPP